jgi:fatty acid kinase
VTSEEVLVLPNSPNVILAAQEAAKLSEKPARVVPSRSQQAALAALVELVPDEDAATNAESLEAALAEIRSGAVAPAARDDAQGRFVRGDAVGFAEDAVVAWGGAGSTLSATIERVAEGAEIVTVIAGDGAPIPLSQLPLELPDGLELELQHGGQPNYWWLIAAQ